MKYFSTLFASFLLLISFFIFTSAYRYEKCLDDAMRKQYDGKKDRELQKPKKFEYKKLEELNVIADSEMSIEQLKKVKFAFSAPEPGMSMFCVFSVRWVVAFLRRARAFAWRTCARACVRACVLLNLPSLTHSFRRVRDGVQVRQEQYREASAEA